MRENYQRHPKNCQDTLHLGTIPRMKNCPLCATEYYDEVKWCPECEYDFPSGAPAPPPGSEEIWSAMEKQSRDLDIPEGPAASIAERITELYLASEGNENDIWKRSPEFLKL